MDLVNFCAVLITRRPYLSAQKNPISETFVPKIYWLKYIHCLRLISVVNEEYGALYGYQFYIK
jgi:hypothetical protein